MRVAIVDLETSRRNALNVWLTNARHEVGAFENAAAHLGDEEWASADVVFLHFSDRQRNDWRELLPDGGYRGRKVVLYAGGEAAWNDYDEVPNFQDPQHCVYRNIVGNPPSPTVAEDFLRYLKAVGEGRQEGLREILNGIDLLLEAKLELLCRLLEQPPPHLDVRRAISGLEDKLRRVLYEDKRARQALGQGHSSLTELRNALLLNEPEWVR